MTVLVSDMPSEWRGAHKICRPKVRVRLRLGENVTPTLTGLVDTGADITLVDCTIAPYLGISEESMLALPTMPMEYAGKVIRDAYRASVDLLVGKSTSGPFELQVTASCVYFSSDVPGGVQVLLGQHDFLERLVLTHTNQQPRPKLKLNYPG